jgi:hypothetical protein
MPQGTIQRRKIRKRPSKARYVGCIRARRVPSALVAKAAKFLLFPSIAAFVPLAAGACVKSRAANDVGDPGFPFGPSAIPVQQLAYVPDIKPILDRDCLECHRSNGRGNERAGDYSVSTYADVMEGQTRGDAKSSLVRTCAPGGSMYQYFRGDAQTSATLLFRWLVYYNGAQTR